MEGLEGLSGCCPASLDDPLFFFVSLFNVHEPYLKGIKQVINVPPGRDQNGVRQGALDVLRPLEQVINMHKTDARRICVQDIAQELDEVVTQDEGDMLLLLGAWVYMLLMMLIALLLLLRVCMLRRLPLLVLVLRVLLRLVRALRLMWFVRVLWLRGRSGSVHVVAAWWRWVGGWVRRLTENDGFFGCGGRFIPCSLLWGSRHNL